MKRDMELIRLLLMQVESGEMPAGLENYDELTRAYHVALMHDAGLVEASIVKDHRGMVRGAMIFRLTWAGHDFLDAARNDTIWNKAKEKVLRPGASFTFGLLVEYLKTEAKLKLGLPST